MMKWCLATLSLLCTVVVSQFKIDFSSSNPAIVDDPYYDVKVGSLEEYRKMLNSSEKISEKISDLYPVGMTDDVMGDTSLQRSVVSFAPTSLDVSISEMKYQARVAGLAYCNDTVLNNWSCKHCTALDTQVRLYAVLDEPRFETRAIVTINDSKKQIALTFRGSVNNNNWFQNLRMTRTPFPIVEGAEVHRGFKDIVDALQFHFNPAIKKLREDAKYADYNIIVSGHSLGGALASLASIYLQQEQVNLNWEQIKIFTYEQPRVGNIQFAQFLNNLPTTLIRVTSNNDFIPHMPPMFANYRHTFTEIYIEKDKTKICGKEYMEDPNCSNKNVPFVNMDHHNLVWDIGLSRGSC